MARKQEQDALLSVQDAAEMLGYTSAWVKQLCADGILGQRVGMTRNWVIRESDVQRLLEKKRHGERPTGRGPGRPRVERPQIIFRPLDRAA